MYTQTNEVRGDLGNGVWVGPVRVEIDTNEPEH